MLLPVELLQITPNRPHAFSNNLASFQAQNHLHFRVALGGLAGFWDITYFNSEGAEENKVFSWLFFKVPDFWICLNVFELGPAEQLAWLFELLRVHACAIILVLAPHLKPEAAYVLVT